MLNDGLAKRLETLLSKAPGAWKFILSWGALCHGIDDIIDVDNPQITDKKAHVLDVAQLAMDVYSSPFYQQNLWLYPICANIHRVYEDSVAWENEPGWKGEYGDKLRCCGNEVITAILKHKVELSGEELREISLLIREDSWERHHDKDGRPI